MLEKVLCVTWGDILAGGGGQKYKGRGRLGGEKYIGKGWGGEKYLGEGWGGEKFS